MLDFYNARRKELLHTTPNHGHLMVAKLEEDFEVTRRDTKRGQPARTCRKFTRHPPARRTDEATSSRDPNDPACICELTPEHPDIHLGDKATDGSQLRPYIVWFGEAVPKFEDAVREAATADMERRATTSACRWHRHTCRFSS